MEEPDADGAMGKLDALSDSSTGEEIAGAYYDLFKVLAEQTEMIEKAAAVTAADYLESYEFEDGTLYDFFTQSTAEVSGDLTMLYPLVASLSEGQRAGLEFLSLREFVMAANRDTEYSVENIKDITPASVFDGIDRAIYEKGGVALTYEAKRANALATDVNLADRSKLSTKSIVCWAVIGATALGFNGRTDQADVRRHDGYRKLCRERHKDHDEDTG